MYLRINFQRVDLRLLYAIPILQRRIEISDDQKNCPGEVIRIYIVRIEAQRLLNPPGSLGHFFC